MQQRPMILGVPFDAVSLEQALARTMQALQGEKLYHVVTPGPEFVMTSRHHQEFCDALRQADLSLPDGFGVIAASRFLGQQPPLQRIPGMTYLDKLLEACSREGVKIFFYGGLPGVANTAVERVLKRFPKVVVAGTESGWRGWLRVPDKYIAWRIRSSRAQVLLVALGAPRQELWINKHRNLLGHVRVAIGVGGAFDFWSERIRRAPVLFQRLGLEWTWRLLQEPRQRWRRIVTATWHFSREVWREKRRQHV